ncbi:hypothetical protein D918_01872 [Trichuris suis]|nr:hypothetical protein D918_01872 [Trichuris suis]
MANRERTATSSSASNTRSHSSIDQWLACRCLKGSPWMDALWEPCENACLRHWSCVRLVLFFFNHQKRVVSLANYSRMQRAKGELF